MLSYGAAYFVAVIALAVLDVVWIGGLAKGLYQRALGPLIAERPNLIASALFYLIYPVGIVIFAVAPALAAGGWSHALIFGLLFGFFNYATYDLTNWAVIKNWPASPLGFDLPWGTVLTGVIAVAAYFAASWIGPLAH